jgi:hypothetical protein
VELEEMSNSAIDTIFEGLEDQMDKLTKWERDFVESVSDQFTRTRSLSDKQKLILGKIWDKY